MAQQRKVGADGQPEEESFFAKYVIFSLNLEMANHHWHCSDVSVKRSRRKARTRCFPAMMITKGCILVDWNFI